MCRVCFYFLLNCPPPHQKNKIYFNNILLLLADYINACHIQIVKVWRRKTWFFFIYCKKIFFRVCWRLHRARNLCSQLCKYTAVASGQEKRRGMWELGYLQWPWNLRSIYILQQVSRLLGGAAALSHSHTSSPSTSLCGSLRLTSTTSPCTIIAHR